MIDYIRDGQEIYRNSFAIIRAEAKLERIPADLEKLAVRVIHACGMVDAIDGLQFSEGAGKAGRDALADQAQAQEQADIAFGGGAARLQALQAQLAAVSQQQGRTIDAAQAHPALGPGSQLGSGRQPLAQAQGARRAAFQPGLAGHGQHFTARLLGAGR